MNLISFGLLLLLILSVVLPYKLKYRIVLQTFVKLFSPNNLSFVAEGFFSNYF
jgi:hypothetical protein